MAGIEEVDVDDVDYCLEERSVAAAGGFGRYGGGRERHVIKGKFKEVDISCTSGGVERHVIKEDFEVVDMVSRTSGDVERHFVKQTFEEVDSVSRTSGHHHNHHHRHHHGHGVDTGGHHHHHHYDQGVNTGGHHHHQHAHHGHDVVVRETKVEEDFNTRTGEFHKRKETFFARDD